MTYKQQQKAWKKWKKEYGEDFFYSDLEKFLYELREYLVPILDKHYKVKLKTPKKTLRTCANCKGCSKCGENIMAGEKYYEYHQNGKKYEHKKCPKSKS